MNKPDPKSFAEKISALQRDQLIDWLTDHSYPEVVELVAAPPPEGFGFEVSASTICRFHKANMNHIAAVRQDKLSARGADQRHYGDTLDQFYRQNLAHGAQISLLERYYELLSRPVDNVDELKKLVYISKQIKDLEIPLDPEEELKNQALKLLLGHPFDRYMKLNADRFKVQRPAADSGQHEVSPTEKPANASTP